ncbi:MAG: radical SAM protein [Candidatus Omnitrophica bacterium]|nr:radical SAM protein [Candidatus Omnitrophota bacterium]
MEKKIKIIKVPGFHDFQLDHFNELLLPPLGVAVISKYLRELGYDIEQDDLNAKLRKEQISQKGPLFKQSLIKQFSLEKKEKIFDYLKGKRNKKIDKILHLLFMKTDIQNIDVLLLSCYQTDPLCSLLSLCMAYYAKRKNRSILIIVGGEHHAQQLGPGRNTFIKDNIEEVFKLGVIDFYIRGAGEESLHQLLCSLDSDGNISTIKGLFYKSETGDAVKNELAMPEIVTPDFDGLPMDKYLWQPNTILLKTIQQAKASEDDQILALPYQFMVGCPSKCAFCECSNPKLKLNVQKPADTVKTLQQLSSKYKTGYFFFLNACLNISKSYIEELCDKMISSGLDIMWTDCARVDNLDKEMLFKMKKAGARRLVFGLETGSERILKYLGKRITISEVENVLKWCYEADIWCCLELIPGLPYESEEDINITIEFLKRNHKYIDTAFSNTFYLEPNSFMACHPKQYGLENIRQIPKSLRRFTTPSYSLAFDEINRLTWEQKVEQQYNSYVRIREVLEKLELDHPNYIDSMHVLFYLYSKYSDKQTIRDKYRKYFHRMKQNKRKDLMLYALKNPHWVFSRFLKVKSLKELQMLFREF